MKNKENHNQQSITFGAQNPGRLDKIIANHLPKYSRAYIAQLIKQQHATVNQNIIDKPSYQVNCDDQIVLKIPPSTPLTISATKGSLDIIYEDQNFICLNKPSNLPVHTSFGHQTDTLVNILLYHYPNFINFQPINNVLRPGIVHRLDKDTSGLIIVAKNQDTLNFFQQEIKNHHWQKKYQALVLNDYGQSRGVIIKNIHRHPHKRQQFTTTKLINKGKTAETIYQSTSNYQYQNHQFCLLDVEIKTGRTHQIRVHLLSENMPIIGDQTYFNKDSKKISQLLKINRQLLHAYYLKIRNPQTLKTQIFQINLPLDFQKILSIIKK